MKRAAILMAVLGMCSLSLAQDNKKPAAQNPPAGPTTGQAAPAPQGKRPPQAKTQAEFEAYNAAKQLADPAAAEKAADDFATKYPDSELRVELYKMAMQKYQQNNNGEKMLEMGQKALTYDADDPAALVGTAQVLAERTRDTDLDKDQRLAEAKKDAELVGLVYALTPKPKTSHLRWYERPGILALGILALCAVLNIIFW